MAAVTASRSKPVVVSARAEEILRTISEYRYMTALDVSHSLFSPKSLTYVRRILSALSGGEDYAERRFLYRFPLPTSSTGNREKVYTLGAKGRDFLVSLGLPVDWYFRPHKVRNFSHSHILHNLILTRLVVSAHAFSRQSKEYRLIDSRLCYELAQDPPMVSIEKDGKTGEVAVIPDAALLFAQGTHKFPILLELDRGMEYQERFKQHVRHRIALLLTGAHTRLFQTTAVVIAYATTGAIPQYRDTRRTTMQRWTQEVVAEVIAEEDRKDWLQVFRFCSLGFGDIYATQLFQAPVWYRPDSPTTPVPLLTP